MSPKSNKAADVEPELPGWQAAYKIRDALVQKDVAAFEIALHAQGAFAGAGSGLVAERALKAAIEAGWLVEPACEVLTDKAGDKRHFLDKVAIDEADPGKVRWYGDRVLVRYTQSQRPPPN